jgi:hypothetical protein
MRGQTNSSTRTERKKPPLKKRPKLRLPTPPDEPLAQESPEGTAPPSKPDDLFDGGLMDLFREAQNEVEESTLATDLPDIPMEDLLSDLVSVSRRLGIEPGTGSLRRANALDSDGDHRARRK